MAYLFYLRIRFKNIESAVIYLNKSTGETYYFHFNTYQQARSIFKQEIFNSVKFLLQVDKVAYVEKNPASDVRLKTAAGMKRFLKLILP